MSQPMFTIQSGESEPPKAIANLLPCRIHCEGPVDSAHAFWKPTTTTTTSSEPSIRPGDDNKTAYFRGRKLQGRSVRLPDGYRGVVVEKQSENQPTEREARRHLDEVNGHEQEEDEGEKEKLGAMQITAKFDQVVVWGHESTANAETDPHVRGMEEWVQVAERIHSYSSQEK
ncbi:hypothetical protein ACRALDRAFT_1073328 [Sodiomyces alcalophilus JCM 7366]|uniref:uncharacterized protein n=1 Tax=Sodiomyces alcalophilus JCM 7366 TaxID=591952 RepID=UPI0039B5BC83